MKRCVFVCMLYDKRCRVLQVLDETGEKVITTDNASVVGWLPASMSNFVDDDEKPAALWHIRFRFVVRL